uniref:Uncharacterized protein n=1 Tax=Xenopus tropicalis TaxID=8364 RepID=A0A803J4T6_XENTR
MVMLMSPPSGEHSNGVYGRIARRKPLLSPKILLTVYSFLQIMGTNQKELEECFVNGAFYIWRKKNTPFQHKNLILSVKHGGGSVLVWAFFVASGPGRLAINDGTMNSELYQRILKENVKTLFMN